MSQSNHIELEELARWTPVSVSLDGPNPYIDWCDLTGERFTDAFFDQTVARLTSGDNPRRKVRTGLDALLELDGAPSLEPSGIIFHLSRCGSTVASRLLGSVPGVVTIVEPAPINSLLEISPDLVNEDIQIRVLQLLVRALGRRRFADDRHLVLKLSSWNIRSAALLTKAFPGVKMAWLQRDPIEVVGSMLLDPPGWARLQQVPSSCRHLFGIDSFDLAAMDQSTFYCFALRAMLESAQLLNASVIDYADMPNAVWRDLAPLFEIGLTEGDIVRMRALARFNAKQRQDLLFTPDAAEKRDVARPAEDLCRSLLNPLYDALAARRISGKVAGRPMPETMLPEAISMA